MYRPLMIVAVVLLTTAPAAAAPDFSRSRISISPAAIAEGDLVTITVEVHNSGDQDAPYTDVTFEMPLEAMFVSHDGFDEAQVNVREKVIGGSIDLPVGATRIFRVRMVVPRDAGGRVLSPHLTVKYLHTGTEFYGHESYDVDTHVRPGLFSIGRVQVGGAGALVLLVLAAFPLLWLGIRLMMPGDRAAHDESGRMRGALARTVGPATAAFVILLPFGFWMIFGFMAVRDWRSITSWPQTSCTITDSRLREDSGPSTQGAAADGLRRTRATSSRTFEPLLALRYDVDGREHISTGFQIGSHLRVGGRSRAADGMSAWEVGRTVPCWYNPSDPADVVVRNGFGGAYLFALFPLPVAIFAFYRTRALVSRRRR